MSALSVELANALIEHLQGVDTPYVDSIFRTYIPRKKLGDADGGKIYVAVTQEETSYASRTTRKHDFTVQIALLVRLESPQGSEGGEPDNAEIDELTLHAQRIRESLAFLVGLVGEDGTKFKHQSESRSMFEPDHIVNLNQFTSVITTTFTCEV